MRCERKQQKKHTRGRDPPRGIPFRPKKNGEVYLCSRWRRQLRKQMNICIPTRFANDVVNGRRQSCDKGVHICYLMWLRINQPQIDFGLMIRIHRLKARISRNTQHNKLHFARQAGNMQAVKKHKETCQVISNLLRVAMRILQADIQELRSRVFLEATLKSLFYWRDGIEATAALQRRKIALHRDYFLSLVGSEFYRNGGEGYPRGAEEFTPIRDDWEEASLVEEMRILQLESESFDRVMELQAREQSKQEDIVEEYLDLGAFGYPAGEGADENGNTEEGQEILYYLGDQNQSNPETTANRCA